MPWLFVEALVAIGAILAPPAPLAPPTPAQVREQVARLDAAEPADRESAEQAILRWGPATLDLLPDPQSDELSAEQRFRLLRLLPQLQEARIRAMLEGSTIRLNRQPIRLSELLGLIQEQTGNRLIDLRPELQQPAPDLSIDMFPPESRFWDLVAMLQTRTGLADFPNQEGGQVGLAEGESFPGPEVVAGPMRLRVQRVLLRREMSLEAPAPECFLDLAIDFEPRLRPVQVQIPAEGWTAQDDLGNNIPRTGPERQYLSLDDGANRLEATVRWQSPPRGATQLAEVRGTLELAIATGSTSFSFPDFARNQESEQTLAGTSVRYLGLDTQDPGVWSVRVVVSREASNEESYLQAELRNDAFLLGSKGPPIPPEGGMNSQDLGDGRTEFEYLFVDLPGEPSEYRLRVDVPGRIVRTPISFLFRDIKLP
jgi:hypothetical protein